MNEKLAIELFKAKIPIFGNFPFKLHEKYPQAPLFLMKINLREPPRGNLTDELLEEIGQHFVEMARNSNLKYDLVTGLPKAGEPLARAFINAHPVFTSNNLLFLEKEETQNKRRILPKITREFVEGQIVIVIDDVISLADTKIEGIEALRFHNLAVTDCLVIMDWELGAREILAEFGVKLHTGYTVSELLAIWIKNKFISKAKASQIIERKNEIKEYIEQNPR